VGWWSRKKTLRQAARRASGTVTGDTRRRLEREIANYDSHINAEMGKLVVAIETEKAKGNTHRLRLLLSAYDKVASHRLDDITEEEQNLEY